MWAAAGILSGWLGDKYGPAWIGCATILLSLPWYGLVAIEGSLAMFLTFFALEGKHKPNPSIWSCPLTIVNPLVFFASGLNPPVMLELSSVSRTIEGVGCMTFILAYRSTVKLTPPTRCSCLWGFQPRVWDRNDR